MKGAEPARGYGRRRVTLPVSRSLLDLFVRVYKRQGIPGPKDKSIVTLVAVHPRDRRYNRTSPDLVRQPWAF